jgi:hypothetical protein
MRVTTALLLAPLLVACKIDVDPLGDLTLGTTGGTDDSATSNGTEAGSTGGGSDPTTTNNTSQSTDTTNTSNTTTGDPGTTTQTSATTTSETATTTTTSTTGNPVDPYEAARQICVDTINMYRATLGLPAYARWTDAESCSDDEAMSDLQSQTPHGAFGMCGEWAQNECPGWPGPPDQSLPDCLAQMWAEGPGQDFNLHGHYINMSSEMYTQVACGFAEVNGEFWMVQNFQ